MLADNFMIVAAVDKKFAACFLFTFVVCVISGSILWFLLRKVSIIFRGLICLLTALAGVHWENMREDMVLLGVIAIGVIGGLGVAYCSLLATVDNLMKEVKNITKKMEQAKENKIVTPLSSVSKS